ncbi:MAG: hypothetical protein UV48_C0001G0029 [Candidatus Azambacteria bacterium GW2011_GWA2_42_9]|uniref:Uncharacterized protein n=3 Tax=Candidatus Azamiibacteriota TaxID=1752741 RepID=A0A0G0Z6X3_9BACT|nr:MAG: hypothetical protein UV07_C0008G0006 [Candidatus Azambacteria bacterium GW2011_GWB1_42_17]KKS76157.1 MAG: hypothetical protein UV48_C0001G0029 [Candidatus Azambacteria bacterium GW2011_GWA2_42_9]KKS88211.1 MAG: hypothetical protein UV62_C0011G0007 [Parcubacteria group bacterium GW2011_GWC1_43_11]
MTMSEIKSEKYSELFKRSVNIITRESLEKEASFDVVLDNPEIVSYTTINYELNEYGGRELRSERRIGFIIPKEFHNRLVRDVILKHRKDNKYAENIGPDRHDPHGAYSLVELHDWADKKWVGWVDPKGHSPIKFAEPRSANDPENEVLHDWIATVGKIQSDAVRVTNVGNDRAYSVSQIHGLEIVFFPELENVSYKQRIYSSGTHFIDLENNNLSPAYGGGSHTEGIYQGAIALNQRGVALYELRKNPGPEAILEQKCLRIKLEAGQSLVQVEIAIGDSEHLERINTKTNRKIRFGYAKLWVGIKKKNSDKINWFVKNANIPPQGVISGAPKLNESHIEDGDELIIEGRDDATYIMGWRLAYKNPKEFKSL